MTATVTWLARQGRRLRWVARDLLYCGRGLPAFLRGARQADEASGIGVIEGAPRAVQGGENVYRIRLVNDTTMDRDVEVHVRGTASTGVSFAVRAAHGLAEHTAADLYIGTDWLARFELVTSCPAVDALSFLAPAPEIGRCTLSVTLSERGLCLDELRITQPLSS